MSHFKLGPDASCDLDILLDTRALVQANSGGGKSWVLRRLLEQTHGKVQQIVIDPEGEFATLRERYDYILAAKQGADTAADPRAAKLLAERLLELRVSAILDIYELKAHERITFVERFLSAMVDAPKSLWHPVLVVLDEAHVFCPQKGEASSAGAVIDLATRGRKRGFCAVLATQRLSKLHKDAAAELNNKLIGRTGLDVDRIRAGEELGFTAKADQVALRQLEPGEFWAFGPALSVEPVKIRVGDVKTTHPKAGARIAFTPPPPTEKVKALLPKLADLPAEAEHKQRSEEELRKELVSARATITRLERAAPARLEIKTETKVERVDVPMITDAQVEALKNAVRDVRQAFEQGAVAVDRMVIERGELAKAAHALETAIGQAVRRPAPMLTAKVPHLRPAARPRATTTPIDGDAPSGVQQRILNALAELEVLGADTPAKELVATMAGYSNIASKGFANAIGALRTSGLVDYPQAGTVALTELGRAQADGATAPESIDELHARILRVIGGQGERILRPLLAVYPDAMPVEELLEASGYGNAASKGFANTLGRLRSLGFVARRGAPQALPVLFPAGLV